MAYDVTEERLKVKGSEQITRDLKVNRDAFINGKAETGSIDDKGDLKVAGEILAGDDVTISGDLYVNGTEYINDSETAQTTDNYLVLRHNQTTPLGTDEYSGVAVHNYASGKTATITTDKDGTWRVADNTETDTNYTNISYYDGVYYTGLTRTATTVISGIKTAFDEDELDECVYYNTSYYHFDGNNWFPVSLVDNRLTLGSAITDSTIIAALNALTKEDLVYFRTLTITVISPVENQPLLTRAESSDLTGGQALTWDATNQKAVGKTIDTTVTADSSNLITSGAVKTAIDNAEANAKCLDNATGVLDITHGGTGATCAADARACLGLGDISTINANNCTIEFLRGDGTWAPPSNVASCACYLLDAGNANCTICANFAAAGIDNPTWLAVWNGYELRATKREKLCVCCATNAACAGQASCVMDFKRPTQPIYIGYAGDSLTCAQIDYLAAYSTNLCNGCKVIKDAPKDVVQSWLGLGSAAYCATSAFRSSSWTPSCVACAGCAGCSNSTWYFSDAAKLLASQMPIACAMAIYVHNKTSFPIVLIPYACQMHFASAVCERLAAALSGTLVPANCTMSLQINVNCKCEGYSAMLSCFEHIPGIRVWQ